MSGNSRCSRLKRLLAEVAARLEIPEVKPEWLGANIFVLRHSGFHPAAALDAAAISLRCNHRGGYGKLPLLARWPRWWRASLRNQMVGLVASAMHKRGVTAWVEREGIIKAGDEITSGSRRSGFSPHGVMKIMVRSLRAGGPAAWGREKAFLKLAQTLILHVIAHLQLQVDDCHQCQWRSRPISGRCDSNCRCLTH